MRLASVFAALVFAAALFSAPIPAAYAAYQEQPATLSQSAASGTPGDAYDRGWSCAPGSGPSAICPGD